MTRKSYAKRFVRYETPNDEHGLYSIFWKDFVGDEYRHDMSKEDFELTMFKIELEQNGMKVEDIDKFESLVRAAEVESHRYDND